MSLSTKALRVPSSSRLSPVQASPIDAGVVDMSLMDNDPYARDNLRYSTSAPKWIQDWDGPFEVEWEVLEDASA